MKGAHSEVANKMFIGSPYVEIERQGQPPARARVRGIAAIVPPRGRHGDRVSRGGQRPPWSRHTISFFAMDSG